MRTSFTPSVSQLTLLCYMTRDCYRSPWFGGHRPFFALSYCPYYPPVFYASCLGAITLCNWPIWKERLVRVQNGEICSDCKIKWPFWPLLTISNWTLSLEVLSSWLQLRVGHLPPLTWIGLNEMKKCIYHAFCYLRGFTPGVKVKHFASCLAHSKNLVNTNYNYCYCS